MKSQQKKMLAKKPKQRKVAKSQDDNTVVLGGYGAIPSYNSYGTDTITLSPSTYGVESITVPSTITTTGTGGLYNTAIPNGGYVISTGGTGAGSGYNWSGGITNTNTTVEINADGMKIKEGGDITIGGKSLSEAIDKIEERLGILNPNPALEERWDKLKDLRKQYIEMEKDLLEKEKLMKILKEA
jgi:hypothetical protein